jgi:protein-tyrosine kinase
MSRIFDALRKSEREHAGYAGARATGAHDGWRELATAMTISFDGLDQVPTIRAEAANGHRPVAAWHGVGQETFRVLHHRLELIRRLRPLKKLLITSAIPKEGKTTIAINLAVALARSSERVLLIDADLRHPGVHRSLGIAPQAGLAELVEQGAELNAVLRRVDPYGFLYLSSGETATNPGELLRQTRMQEFLAGATSAFDWVLVDSPPLVPFVDAHHLATLVDGVLLVLRRGVTPRATLEQAFASLDRAFVAGAVLNGARDGNRHYYGYYGQKRPARSLASGPTPAHANDSGASTNG